jgi:hypothetical protein
MNRWLPVTVLAVAAFALSGCQSLQPSGTGKAGAHGAVATLRCGTIDTASDAQVAASINLPPEKLVDLKNRRSVTNDDICSMPEHRYQRMMAKFETPKPDHPGEWATFRALQRRGSDGEVRPDGLINGLQQRRDLLALQAQAAANGKKLPSEAGINVTSWTDLGPGNIGGRIRAIAIHPTQTSTIFIGSVSGGIWKSVNGGASWSAVNDFMGNLSVSSIVFDPNNPDILYAGTGEGFYNADAVRGYGVFKSVDGGVTWNQLPATIPSSDKNSASYSWFYVNHLAIAADGTLLAATGGFFGNSGKIWRSTDGGTTWTATYSNRILDVRFDPNNSSKALATALAYNFTSQMWESHIIRSVDGGQSWTDVQIFTNNDSRIELAYTRADSQVVYASRDNANGEIWRSGDGGLSWTLTATPKHLGDQGWYDNTIWVDPTNPAHLVIGGIDLYRSTDSGVTWTKVSTWSLEPSSPHADHHIIVNDPGYDGGSNSRVYEGNDGGIYKADNIKVVNANGSNNGWTNLNNGLAITQFYGAAGSPATNRVYGGTQDNGSLLQPASGSSWTKVYGGDGGYCAVDASGSYLFGEYVYLQMHRSTNGGASPASPIDSGIGDAGSSTQTNFIAPFILDPNNDSTLLAGGSALWRSTNAKATPVTWSAIKSPAAKPISAIAVRQGEPGLIWVGHNDGSLYKSVDGTTSAPTWTPVGKGTGNSFTPARMVLRILVDKTSPDTVYVAYGGYAADNLYRTTNGGLTWQNIHGNLPTVPIFTIARHPVNASWLYAGTEVGLFTSMDAGATWKTSTDGPANVEISELFWLNNSTLVAATHGRGVFRATVVAADASTPVANNDSYTAGLNTELIVPRATGVLANDTDQQGSTLAAHLVTPPAHARTFTLNPDGSFIYYPEVNYLGSDSFTYQASDTFNQSAAATATITVKNSDQLPVNGVCGDSINSTFITPPTTGLCASGTPSVVTETTTWNWTCSGLNGGTTASCSAQKIVPITINGGAAFAAGTTVTLTLAAPGGQTFVRLSNDTIRWSKWLPLTQTMTWKLASKDGPKTVTAQFASSSTATTGQAYSAGIFLDTKAPGGSIKLNGGAKLTNNPTVSVSVTPKLPDTPDTLDGICLSESNLIPCSPFAPFASPVNYTITTPGDGKKTVFVTLRDKSGKSSKPLKGSITLDITPPTGSIFINKDALTTAIPLVSLKMTAVKATQMQLSLDGGATWGAWEKFASGKKVTLVSGPGENVVKVRFRDAAGNVSIDYSDSITLL